MLGEAVCRWDLVACLNPCAVTQLRVQHVAAAVVVVAVDESELPRLQTLYDKLENGMSGKYSWMFPVVSDVSMSTTSRCL